MNRFTKLITAVFLSSVLLGESALATSEIVVFGDDSSPSAPAKLTSKKGRYQEEAFAEKSQKEREQLPEKEQEIIGQLETYLTEKANPKARNFGPTLNKLIAGIAFDLTVRRENLIFNSAEFFDLPELSENDNWFDNLTNKSERFLTVYDEPTHSNLQLHAYYVDNQSSKTAVIQHGYRADAMSIMREAEFFSSLGYNLIIPDARSHGASQGEFIAFGAYEKNDINGWIDQELANKPKQDIVLFGVSMGAATVMMSQEKPRENVKAVIEDCGYYAIEQQARDVMRLLTSRLQYIPLVNKIDWFECEDELIDSMNDNFVKPILKVDLYTISPLNATKTSNVPTMFIHGTEDWFIPPIAKDKLYAASISYKQQLAIEGAGHAENLTVGGAYYKENVRHFLETVDQLEGLRPQLAETTNLLVNTAFVRNQDETSFDSWKISSNGSQFNDVTEANPYEFVVKKNARAILAAISVDNQGLKFYNRNKGTEAYVGQAVELVKGEEYALGFDSYNPKPYELNRQLIRYGVGQHVKKERQTAKKKVSKEFSYTADTTGPQTVFLGAEMTYSSLFDRVETVMYYSDVTFINTDTTPPEKATISSVETVHGATIVKGNGEAETSIQLLLPTGQQVLETKTGVDGSFEVTIPKETAGTVRHLVNQDIKGNRSSSIVFVSN